jgi:hypothetical protein
MVWNVRLEISGIASTFLVFIDHPVNTVSFFRER